MTTDTFDPCTSRDPRCEKLAERQAKLYASMRRTRSHLFDRKATITSAAATDVAATIHRAQSVILRPVRSGKKEGK